MTINTSKKSSIALLALAGSLFVLPHIATAAVGSPYISSNLGYDVSFTTKSYPTWMSFALFSVTRGKAFRHNERLLSEFLWAKLGSSSLPTLYMNLNAPYGSTVAGNTNSPKDCSRDFVSTSTEPTACQGYNYGYNTAQDAYAYAKTRGIESQLWWLDIEIENSWSKTPAVNQATIQGAIDYLNARNSRVGIYSMPFMWKQIMGKGFTPIQTISGQGVAIPVWLPIGVASQVRAINTCNTGTSFIPGSPIWLVQYEANSRAIDQNLAC